jgi:hypothetical protein
MKPKNLVLKIVEHTTANQAKVGYIIFPLARVSSPPFFAATEFQGNAAGVRCVGNAIPETVVAGPKDGPEYALARYFSPFMDETQAVTVANAARFFGQTNCVRSIPLHLRMSSRRRALKYGSGRRQTTVTNSSPERKFVKQIKYSDKKIRTASRWIRVR